METHAENAVMHWRTSRSVEGGASVEHLLAAACCRYGYGDHEKLTEQAHRTQRLARSSVSQEPGAAGSLSPQAEPT